MRVRIELSRGKYHGRHLNKRVEKARKGISMELHLPEPLLENTEAMTRVFEAAHQALLDHYVGGVLRGNPVSVVVEETGE